MEPSNGKPRTRPWRVISEEIANKHDVDRFLALCREWDAALEDQHVIHERNVTQITGLGNPISMSCSSTSSPNRELGWEMERKLRNETVERLVRLGNAAGFSVEELVDMLRAGLSVEGLLQLLASRLPSTPITPSSSRWIT